VIAFKASGKWEICSKNMEFDHRQSSLIYIVQIFLASSLSILNTCQLTFASTFILPLPLPLV